VTTKNFHPQSKQTLILTPESKSQIINDNGREMHGDHGSGQRCRHQWHRVVSEIAAAARRLVPAAPDGNTGSSATSQLATV